jgi:hypothetical protein
LEGVGDRVSVGMNECICSRYGRLRIRSYVCLCVETVFARARVVLDDGGSWLCRTSTDGEFKGIYARTHASGCVRAWTRARASTPCTSMRGSIFETVQIDRSSARGFAQMKSCVNGPRIHRSEQESNALTEERSAVWVWASRGCSSPLETALSITSRTSATTTWSTDLLQLQKRGRK